MQQNILKARTSNKSWRKKEKTASKQIQNSVKNIQPKATACLVMKNKKH
jgi:hypothetical protein